MRLAIVSAATAAGLLGIGLATGALLVVATVAGGADADAWCFRKAVGQKVKLTARFADCWNTRMPSLSRIRVSDEQSSPSLARMTR